MARGVGVKRDLRLALQNSYAYYKSLPVKSYCGHTGDSYDRFLIRMLEMGESLKLVNLVALKLLNAKNTTFANKLVTKNLYTRLEKPYTSMEDLITHFCN